MLLVAFPLLLLIFFLCLQSLLDWLVYVLACFSLGLSCMGLCASWTWLTISFPMLGKLSTLISWKIFSYSFFSLLFLWMLVHLILSQRVSETILSVFHFFPFILLFSSYFHHSIFQLTYLIFCLRYSAIDSFQSIFNSSNCVVSICLFFISSISLLIDSCIFYVLFLRFWTIFSIIMLNSFLVVCLFPLHLFGLVSF